VDKIESSFERHLYGVDGYSAGRLLEVPRFRDALPEGKVVDLVKKRHSSHSFILDIYHCLLSQHLPL
jgi:hypothetical protein